jgi:hypothetical protein
MHETRYRQRYNLYLDTLSMNDSLNVKRITILVSGFLQLSLIAGLLSMLTRFANLEFLIYNFVVV